MGLVASHTLPLTEAARIFLASPSEIERAISMALVPGAYSLTAPSGNVILIIFRLSIFIRVLSAQGSLDRLHKRMANLTNY
jgi:hypothetical protein